MAAIATVSKKPHWQLTPHPIRSCWKKKHEGQVYYVGNGTERYSEAEYKTAWTQWEAKLAELEAAKRKTPEGGTLALAKAFNLVEGSDVIPTPDEIKKTFAGTDHEGGEIEQRVLALAERKQVQRFADKIKTGETGPTVRTVAAMLEKFLNHKRNQAKSEMKSVGRFANLESYLKNFETFIGSETPMKDVDAITLTDYYNRQLEEILAEKISDYYGRDRLVAAKQFIRWTWEQGACELPRNIESKELSIGVTVGDVEPMPVKCLRDRITAATGRLKLELLLMANCGFTQVDTGDLLHTELNWQAGTITRQRSKKTKGKEKNMPTVTWTLWPTTLELLRELATKDSPHVLATRDGNQTSRDSFNDAGKAIRNDAMGQAYRKFEEKLIARQNAEELPKLSPQQQVQLVRDGVLELVDKKLSFRSWSPKHVRKTSSTAIGNSKDYSRFAQYFLGQAPETVADTHYIKPSAELFRDCCRWLGRELQLDDMAAITPTK